MHCVGWGGAEEWGGTRAVCEEMKGDADGALGSVTVLNLEGGGREGGWRGGGGFSSLTHV